ncbi:MAG: hypothetical protein J1F23_03150 [Oscillospiraceae bacterium]|nr:hypothetical protein [Oscillospiraceae bacterium]
MFKKVVALIFALSFIFLCACSQESKFGIEQFVDRMNKSFETDFLTSEFLLGSSEDGSEWLFSERGNSLITLFLDTNSNIKGASVLVTDNGDINSLINTYLQLCCVLTGSSVEEQSAVLQNCGITADKIKFADSNIIITVGKYKYVAVGNTYSITLICERN